MIRPTSLVMLVLLLVVATPALPAAEKRCLVVEVFAAADDTAAELLVRRLEVFATDRGGVRVVRRFTDTVAEDHAVLTEIAAAHGLDAQTLPVVRACGAAFAAAGDPADAIRRLDGILRVEVFTRRGCSRCERAKEWLPTWLADYPGLRLVVLDASADAGARTAMADLVRRHKTPAASVPVFHLGQRLVVGFDRPEAMRPDSACRCSPWHWPRQR